VKIVQARAVAEAMPAKAIRLFTAYSIPSEMGGREAVMCCHVPPEHAAYLPDYCSCSNMIA
jgi:hypothetical protein